MARPPAHWLPLFEEFVKDLRIQSKEFANPDGTGTELRLWESQHRFMREVSAGLDNGVRTFFCLKSRQLGVTTISLAIDLFWLSMHPGIVGALVTEDEANRDKNRAVLKQYVESFPEGYFGYDKFIIQNSRLQMTFANGSRLDFKVAGTKKKSTAWGEGEGYAYVHATEVASYGDMDGLRSFEESFAQKNPSRLFLYESTPKGFNLWRDKWYSGFDDPETKRSFFIGWWANPMNSIDLDDPRFAKFGLEKATREEREKIRLVAEKYDFDIGPEQLAWYRWREATDEAGADMLAQNQSWTAEESFITSGHSFFQTRLLTSAIRQIEEEPYPYLAYAYDFGDNFFQMKLRVLDDDSYSDQIELKVWEEPQKGAKYVIGCDPAWGRNEHKDGICISVWRCYADRLVQVAEYLTADVEVKYAAWVLAHLGGAYGDAILNIELGGGGRIIMHEWSTLKSQLNSEAYSKYVKSGDWEDALDNARWYLYSRPDSLGAGYAYNFECLALDTLLPTPTGWTTMGEVKEGDLLISDDGKPTQIIGVSDIKTQARCYEIKFDDGTVIVADENHWWKVARRHWKNGDKLRQTRHLEAGKFHIRQASPMELPDVDLPLDPYILGAWLGDGASNGACVYSGAADVDEMTSLIEACGQATRRSWVGTCWRIGLNEGNKGSLGNPVIRKLKELSVFGNKHIPKAYLRGSFQQRLSLLQGLMDTDGCSGGNGGPQCSFVTTFPVLADGFSELLRSLGFKAKKIVFEDSIEYKGEWKKCKMRHQFWFTAYPETPPFRLKRKIERLSKGGRKKYRKPCHRILSIREIESVPVRCVMVDAPSKMFLAGEGMIPTHNTTWRTKMELMHGFRGAFVTNELTIRSKRLLMEMGNVIQDGSTIGAPESSNPDSKDDRVFAAAFAHRAWVNWRRPEMIANGDLYETVTKLETGETTLSERIVTGMVSRFWARQAALAGGEFRQPTWREERGLR